MDATGILVFGVMCFAIGAAIGAWCAWQCWLKYTPPVIQASLVIDPVVLHQVNSAITLAWLDAQGLTWTAKGAVYDPSKVIKK